ncbi:hypothetical protein GGD81_002639 [Rhodobium orientis]|nr:hypothetical protein [Rhodobium orientis]
MLRRGAEAAGRPEEKVSQARFKIPCAGLPNRLG